jgi:hypothetical protein
MDVFVADHLIVAYVESVEIVAVVDQPRSPFRVGPIFEANQSKSVRIVRSLTTEPTAHIMGTGLRHGGKQRCLDLSYWKFHESSNMICKASPLASYVYVEPVAVNYLSLAKVIIVGSDDTPRPRRIREYMN